MGDKAVGQFFTLFSYPWHPCPSVVRFSPLQFHVSIGTWNLLKPRRIKWTVAPIGADRARRSPFARTPSMGSSARSRPLLAAFGRFWPLLAALKANLRSSPVGSRFLRSISRDPCPTLFNHPMFSGFPLLAPGFRLLGSGFWLLPTNSHIVRTPDAANCWRKK